jgi:Protein of unknown function (DUF3179).
VYRREFLAALGASGALAGCLSGGPAGESGDSGGTATPPATPTPAPEDPEIDPENARVAVHGVPPDICETSLNPDPSIYAVVEPVFAPDWSAHEITPAYRHEDGRGELVDDQTVIGLEADGIARAYPLTVLNTHEVVNDRLGADNAAGTGAPVMVTFCPLCSSGMVASRRVGGGATLFAVTGHLWRPERLLERASEEEGRTFGATYTGGEERPVRHNGNLVMYDAATRSYWSQILARGICGSRAGTELEIRPSSVTTWGGVPRPTPRRRGTVAPAPLRDNRARRDTRRRGLILPAISA